MRRERMRSNEQMRGRKGLRSRNEDTAAKSSEQGQKEKKKGQKDGEKEKPRNWEMVVMKLKRKKKRGTEKKKKIEHSSC